VKPVIVAGLTLVPVCAFLCSRFAGFMRRRSLGQSIRSFGPARHAVKAGTPTMGGAVVYALWLAAVSVLLAWHPPTPKILFVVAAASLFVIIGVADDWIALRRRRSMGLSAIAKLTLSSAAALVLFLAFRDVLAVPVKIPFSSATLTLPTVAIFFLAWIVFLSTTNAMNLTDGLDGLAAGTAVLILIGVVLLYPTRENLVLCGPLIGALVGFLWLNVHPAGLIMGDAGSFFLGGVIAALALANGAVLLLPILAGVLVFEAGSVILQIASFKALGKRLFRMSPLHHHFECSTDPPREHILPAYSWPEEKVTVRFWILQGLFIGLAFLAARI
jgi:phospho-N-acetylmuramoyl-pentapeptide-transferase